MASLGDEEHYGGGFVTAKLLISLPQCLSFGRLPCLVDKLLLSSPLFHPTPSFTIHTVINIFFFTNKS